MEVPWKLKMELPSVQFSYTVVSDSLQPHGLQHARLPCPSPSPGACSNSCPLSQWCHPVISSSVVPVSTSLQSFPASGSFPMSQLFISGGQSIGVSASVSVLPMNIQDWFPESVQGTLKSFLQHHSSKASIFQYSALFIVQLSHPYMTTRKIIALTRRTFFSIVTFLLFNMLSRLVIAFLPRIKCLLISWLQSPSAVIFGAQQNKICHGFHCFPTYLQEVMKLDAILVFWMLIFFFFWMLTFKANFSLFSLTSSRGSLVPLCFLP